MTDSLAAALAKLQADLPRIKRTARGQAGTRQYKYPPYDEILRAVRPVLAKHGFVWNSKPTLEGDQMWGGARFVLSYALTYLKTGEQIAGQYPLAEGQEQRQGAAISYAKRYALVAVLDLEVVGEDDDAMPDQGMDLPPAHMRDRMTPTRTTGAEQEQLRVGTMVTGPGDRPAERQHGPVDNSGDMWTDNPPPESQSAESPGGIGKAQIGDIGRAFREVMGVTDSAVLNGMISDMIGRQVLHRTQLSRLEANFILRELRKRKEEQEAGA